MKDIDLAKLKELAARLLNPTDRFSEVSDKFEWKAVTGPAVISALIEQLEAAQRERDEAIKQKNESGERFYKAVQYGARLEAELKRRDEQKPVAWISERNLQALGKQYSVRVKHEPVMVRPIALYAAAPAAVNSPAIPDGWKLVPIELTREMQSAWDSAPNCNGDDDDENMCKAYRAMIAAAPKPE